MLRVKTFGSLFRLFPDTRQKQKHAAVQQSNTSSQNKTNEGLQYLKRGIVLFQNRKFAAKGMTQLETSSSSEEEASIYA